MCIIIVKPAGVHLPDYATICRCAEKNPDGFGFAQPRKKPFKTLDFDAFAAKLYQADEDLPMIIHFRRATHGSVKPSNCHPFKDDITGVSFVHNGILSIATTGDKTDSETAFRLLLAPAIRSFGFGSANFTKAVNSVIGCSRFAFLSDEAKLKMYGNFISYQGCHYSNNSFRW